MSKCGYSFLLLFCFQCKTAEISSGVVEKRVLSSEKKSNFTVIDWEKSSSYVITTLPKEIGFIIVDKLFEFNNEKINNTAQAKTQATLTIALKHFYQKRFYNLSIKSSKLSSSPYFSLPKLKDIHNETLDQLSPLLDSIEKDTARFCCLNNPKRSALIISEENYEKMQKFAKASDLIVDNREVLCCYDCYEPGNTMCSLLLVTASCTLPSFCFVSVVGAALASWISCFGCNGGFRQVYGFHKKNN